MEENAKRENVRGAPSPMPNATLLVKALIAYAVHEHQEGHASRIDVWLGERGCTVQDNGRGMGLDRGEYVEALMGSLSAHRADPVQLHGIGLSLIAMSTPLLRIESRRNGELWTQEFRWGVAESEPCRAGGDSGSGTRITVEFGAGMAGPDRQDVVEKVESWRRLRAGLEIVVHDLGGDVDG